MRSLHQPRRCPVTESVTAGNSRPSPPGQAASPGPLQPAQSWAISLGPCSMGKFVWSDLSSLKGDGRPVSPRLQAGDEGPCLCLARPGVRGQEAPTPPPPGADSYPGLPQPPDLSLSRLSLSSNVHQALSCPQTHCLTLKTVFQMFFRPTFKNRDFQFLLKTPFWPS